MNGGISTGDWIAIYGAILSSLIAIVGSCRFVLQKLHVRRERLKVETDLYFLRKIDKTTGKVYPIVVILVANLGSERVALKSISHEGIAEPGGKTTGGSGWYEQPEELYGIRNRLLPRVLESGQTADFPMVQIGVISRIRDLKLWLTDFNGRRYYIDREDIAKVRRDVEDYLRESKIKSG